MIITPAHVPVGTLFGREAIYEVPKYQRAYAWEEESVEDFLEDTKTCYNARTNGGQIDHFFGGVLCVQYRVTGTVNQYKYELIDGQQRITTYTILASVLIKIYEELLEEAQAAGNTHDSDILTERIRKLEERFIKFSYEINRQTQVVDVLTLSKADNDFYRPLINGLTPTVQRESHKRLEYAYNKIYESIMELTLGNGVLSNRMDNLQQVEHIIDNDFNILHMLTDSKDDAYRLFQVINDRGVSLTEGDLLRAKTLEMLEDDQVKQNASETIWNNILKEHPKTTSDYLTWIYESYVGNRPKKGELYDQFLSHFFPNTLSMNGLYTAVKQLEKDIELCRTLSSLEWFYPIRRAVTKWQRDKLHLLLDTLGHTLSYPLLLAAKSLDDKKFADMIHMLEKIFYRYKIICGQHVTALKRIYNDEALAIRNNPAGYRISSLQSKLNTLIDDKANDTSFKAALQGLEYKPGGSNKLLRYFLLTVEYYYECYNNGNTWTATCIDKSRVYDFVDTSIEHIYPRNANGTDIQPTLEPLKNTLGNLCLMDPTQNTIADNDPFNTKKPIYTQTSVKMLQEISTKTDWGIAEIEASKNDMIEMAVKIFRA